jgi:hypothetical protein
MSAIRPKPTSLLAPHMSAFGGKADIVRTSMPAFDQSERMRRGHSWGNPIFVSLELSKRAEETFKAPRWRPFRGGT